MHAVIYASDEMILKLKGHWESERSYYDSPCGGRSLDLGKVAPGFPASAIRTGHGDVFASAYARCGYVEHGSHNDALWLKCSGAWATTYFPLHCVVVSGPRHAVRELLPDWFRHAVTEYRYLDSQRPDLKPWETTT